MEPQPKIGKLETLPIYCFHSDQRSWTDPQGLQMTIFDKILTLSLTVCIFFVQLCELNLEFCKNGCKSWTNDLNDEGFNKRFPPSLGPMQNYFQVLYI